MQKVKDKEKIMKAKREKRLTYKRNPVRLTSGFSAEMDICSNFCYKEWTSGDEGDVSITSDF